MSYDAIVVGAGFAGAVTARELAERGGKNVLLLERRPHIGGNAYDLYDAAGLLVHRYGPHIFHTNDKRVFDYLSRFTGWLDYQHKVVANIPGKESRVEFPVPFNLCSLETAFGEEKAKLLESKLVAMYGEGKKVTILELRKNEDLDLSKLADYIYQHVFVNYTVKQWGHVPEKIDPNTTARVPIVLSRDCRYFQDQYQGMPIDGYTRLFKRLLEHTGITVKLNTEASDRIKLVAGQILLDEVPFNGPVIYTGAVDELYDCCFGRLPYRTLDFRFETHMKEFYQSHGTINYTVDEEFTRITEFKRLTGQVKPGRTTIVKEYAHAYTGDREETPYYAIINEENNKLYSRYASLAERYPNLYLLGRLAEYKYYNMDAIVRRALDLADLLLG